jgi:hypothetical protein
MNPDFMILTLQQRKKKTSHVLHLLLSVLTGGLWLIIWACCGIANASQNSKIDKEIEQVQAMQMQQMCGTWPPILERKA